MKDRDVKKGGGEKRKGEGQIASNKSRKEKDDETNGNPV